jgi:membrane protease YdiL (CAAX protease family)
MDTDNTQSINYKFVFIAIVIAYFLTTIIIAFIAVNSINIRYYSLLEGLIFLVPILIIGKDDLNFGHISSNHSPLKRIINNYQIFINFKMIVVPCILWATLGVGLFEMGNGVIIEKILPMSWLDYYNDMTREMLASQTALVMNSSNTILEFLQIILFIAVIPAVCEEILFRGYLMQSIRVRNTKGFAIFVSALLFAAIHFNPLGFIPIFVIGLFLGSIFYATRSIIPCILFHFLNNLLVVISANYGSTDNLEYISISIWFGIVTLILGTIIMFIAFRKMKEKQNNKRIAHSK